MTSGPLVALLSTGGTISFRPTVDGRRADFALDADDLVQGSQPPGIEVHPEPVRRLASADMDVSDVVHVAARIDRAVDEGATGVVVSQGTDSLEETAYLLDLLVQTDAPVVVTGAMRNPERPGADGPGNLDAAIRVAADPLACDIGVLVVLGDEIHLARHLRKSHASAPHAFASEAVGPIGWVSEGRVRIPLVPRTRTPRIALPPDAVFTDVALIRAAVAMSPDGFRWPVHGPYAAAVIETMGAGHLSAAVLPAVSELAARMPVVFCSRTGSGETYTSSADYPGSEASLLAAGLIPAGALDGLKARAQLILLLAAGADRDQITSSFAAAY